MTDHDNQAFPDAGDATEAFLGDLTELPFHLEINCLHVGSSIIMSDFMFRPLSRLPHCEYVFLSGDCWRQVKFILQILRLPR